MASIINAISIAPGTAGQVLTSNGAATPATFQAVSGSPVYFSAFPSASITNVTGNGTHYTVIFNSTDKNVGGGYNTGTGLFTAPNTATYQFGVLLDVICTGATGFAVTQNYGALSAKLNGGGTNILFCFLNPYAIAVIDPGSGFPVNSTFASTELISLTSGDTIGLDFNVIGLTQNVGIGGGNPLSGSSSWFYGLQIGS